MYPQLYSDLALGILKASLGFFGSKVDEAVEEYLKQLLVVAASELHKECGVSLNYGEIYDDNLQAMYAMWLYTKRRTGEGKSQMLAQAIRNRQVNDALAAVDREVTGCDL